MIELIEYNINERTGMLNVSMRFMDDDENTIRRKSFDPQTLEDYGFNVFKDDNEFDLNITFDGHDNSDMFSWSLESDEVIDEGVLLEFLKEYYLMDPSNEAPKPEKF